MTDLVAALRASVDAAKARRQDDMVILVGLNGSMANWARMQLADQGIDIPRQNVYTMGNRCRFLEGRRFTKCYVYDAIRPGESLAVLDDRDLARRMLTYSARKTGEHFQGFYQIMPNGNLHGPTQTL